MARNAEAGAPDMHFSRITARDAVEAGVLAQNEIDDARYQLPAAVFTELYEAEASDDQGNPFGIDAIQQCVAYKSAGEPVAFGVDLAKSVDWTVVVGLDSSNAVCFFDRFQAPWQETVGRVALAVGATPALVDSTGVGDPIVEALQRGRANRVEGKKFTSLSKQQLMEGLAVAIQRREVSFPDGPIVVELDAFEYEYTKTGVKYSASEGLHDDCVCALALAVEQATRPVWNWVPA
jgi:hypothetical protein